MASVREMRDRFAAFNAIAAAQTVMSNEPEKILDKNREQLYTEGIDARGQALEVYEGSLGLAGAREYYEEKVRKNPRVGANPSYDVKDTGATFDSLTLDFSADTYSITPHTEYAYQVAGQDGFGLTDNSKSEYWSESLKSGMVEALADATGCTFV